MKGRKNFQQKKKKNNLVIVFDENARREFLTGFQKRKLERKNRAKEEFEKQLKAERKRIKAEAKEQYKKLLHSKKPLPELSGVFSENIDMGSHTVSVTELSSADLARKNNWIGANEVQYHEDKNEDLNESSNESENSETIEGMEVKQKIKRNNNNKSDSFTPRTCKDIKKKIKDQATKNVKNSKVFRKKAELNKIKIIKLKRKQERKLKKLKLKKRHTNSKQIEK